MPQGHWDGHVGTFTGTLNSDKLNASLAELAHRLAPGAASDLFVARASVLAPAHLILSAQGDRDTDGAITLDQFGLKGSAAGTNIAATINGKIGTDWQNPANLMLSAKLAAPDALILIRQLGLPALPLQGLGPGAIDITASGKADSTFATNLTASLPGATLSVCRRSSAGRDRAFGDRHVCNWRARVAQRSLKRRGSLFPDSEQCALPPSSRAMLDWCPGTSTLDHLSAGLPTW